MTHSAVHRDARPGADTRRRAALSLAALAAALLGGDTPRPAAAASIVVNSLDGTWAAGDGKCTLPEAANNANLNYPASPDCAPGSDAVPDVITFSVSGAITVPSTIYFYDAAGVVIDGAGQAVTLTGFRSEGVVTPVFVQASAEVRNLTIADSTGRGISNQGTVTVRNVTVRGNALGGIGNSGTATIVGTAVLDNTAAAGAGVYNSATGNLTLANSTVHGNVAGLSGGGIENLGGLTVVNSTVAGNTAPQGGGLNGSGVVKNSILANNSAAAGPDCSGAVMFSGPNLLRDPAGCTALGTPPVSADPLLGAPAANGGPTPTLALLSGSPAISAGDAALCAAPPVNGVDQRGTPRPQGAGCDLGAFETATGVAVMGGRNVTIRTGPLTLTWDFGTVQAGYRIYRINAQSGSVDVLPAGPALPAAATSFTDTSVVSRTIYCYFVVPVNAGGGIVGVSDALCAQPGTAGGAVQPGGFSLTLRQTATATMGWAPPPGGADAYSLAVIPLDGAPASTLPLPGGATAHAFATGGVYHCFILIGKRAGSSDGNTDPLCGLPGNSTLVTSGGWAELTARAAALAEALPLLAP